MSKANNTSFFFIILLLCFALSYASRPDPAFHEATLNLNNIDQHQVTKVQDVVKFSAPSFVFLLQLIMVLIDHRLKISFEQIINFMIKH